MLLLGSLHVWAREMQSWSGAYHESLRILNALDLDGVPEAVAELRAIGELMTVPPEREAVLVGISNADIYMATAAVRVDEEFLLKAKRLKLIGSPHTGTDHLDAKRIADCGIELMTITQEYNLLSSFSATSELAFGLILTLVRKLHPAIIAAERGDWARERFSGFQLLGKTLGILGLGRLGCISARIGSGFGMRVIAHDVADVSAGDVEMVDFDTLLSLADILSIHLPLNEGTRSLISTGELARMKPSAILVNTSRGAIIDEDALLLALQKGTIAGAGLDVMDGEWFDDKLQHPLIRYAAEHDNLVITPHIGGSTKESIYGARTFMATKLATRARQLAVR